jgi:hypothetical protein
VAHVEAISPAELYSQMLSQELRLDYHSGGNSRLLLICKR